MLSRSRSLVAALSFALAIAIPVAVWSQAIVLISVLFHGAVGFGQLEEVTFVYERVLPPPAGEEPIEGFNFLIELSGATAGAAAPCQSAFEAEASFVRGLNAVNVSVVDDGTQRILRVGSDDFPLDPCFEEGDDYAVRIGQHLTPRMRAEMEADPEGFARGLSPRLLTIRVSRDGETRGIGYRHLSAAYLTPTPPAFPN